MRERQVVFLCWAFFVGLHQLKGGKLESLSFREKFDILLEKRPNGVAELRYIMVEGVWEIPAEN